MDDEKWHCCDYIFDINSRVHDYSTAMCTGYVIKLRKGWCNSFLGDIYQRHPAADSIRHSTPAPRPSMLQLRTPCHAELHVQIAII